MHAVTVLAVGDVVVDRPEPETIFAHAAERLRAADIVFCQLETVYSTRGSAVPTPGRPLRADPSNIAALKAAGISVVSIAGNHCMDFGAEGMLDMVANLRAAGLNPVGAGRNLEEARAPVIIERHGIRVALLAYSSILLDSSWATQSRAGCAPLRAHTHYEMVEPHQPGCPARIRTFPVREDMDAAVSDVRAAKAKADFVLVSMHWGLHFTPHRFAEYESVMAHALVDAGADAIIGTHPHHLKGMEIYRGRVIAYSLGTFAFDLPMRGQKQSIARHNELASLYPMLADAPREGSFPFPEKSRLTLIMQLRLSCGSDPEVCFLPTWINPAGQPEMLAAGDDRVREIIEFIAPDCAANKVRVELADGRLVIVPI